MSFLLLILLVVATLPSLEPLIVLSFFDATVSAVDDVVVGLMELELTAVSFSRVKSLAKPKSVMQTCPSQLNSIFSGFRSRCNMLLLCKCSKASMISDK